MRKIVFWTILLILSFAFNVYSSSALKILEKKYSGISSVEGRFVQTAIFSDGRKKLFEGMFFIKDSYTRWDYEKPKKQIVITLKNRMFIYDPESNEVMESYIGEDTLIIRDTITANLEQIRKSFRITESANVISLQPVDSESIVRSIKVYVSDTGDIKKVIVVDKMNNKSIVLLKNLKYNVNIPDSKFDIIRVMREGS